MLCELPSTFFPSTLEYIEHTEKKTIANSQVHMKRLNKRLRELVVRTSICLQTMK